MKVSLAVEQRWIIQDEKWLLLQAGRRISEIVPDQGRWLSPRHTTTPGVYGHRYDDLESACAAESDRAATRVLDQLSPEAIAVLRDAGLLA